MLHLGKFAEGYEAGQADTMRTYGLEVVYVNTDEDDEED